MTAFGRRRCLAPQQRGEPHEPVAWGHEAGVALLLPSLQCHKLCAGALLMRRLAHLQAVQRRVRQRGLPPRSAA